MNRTNLFNRLQNYDSKFIDFNGWEMPISFSGTLNEHRSVRSDSGFFDVSHMGRFHIDNSYIDIVNSLICGDISSHKSETALYSMVLNHDSGILDDIIIWKFDSHLVLICNASNTEKVSSWFDINNLQYKYLNTSTSLIAVQGPEVVKKLDKYIHMPDHFECTIDSPAFFDSNVVLARTGYTGEDGVELMINHGDDIKFIDLIDELEIIPCGLGARDTLRLEASLPLYGQELKEDITPVEAGFRWVINFDHEFIGKDNLLDQISTGNHKYIKKFVIDDKIVARYGDTGICGNVEGKVTSGNYSPILKKSIGFILFESKPESDTINFHIRDKLIEGRIIKGKFLSL